MPSDKSLLTDVTHSTKIDYNRADLAQKDEMCGKNERESAVYFGVHEHFERAFNHVLDSIRETQIAFRVSPD